MLEYSTETRQAATVFTEYRNTLDIYTEDCEKDKEFYIKLLKKLLSNTDIIINDIHPLGCRRTVIQCCQDDTDNRRKKLYIVDGDIYLQYKEKECIPNLFVLDAYCIENFMICEEAICYVAHMFHARDSYENVKISLQTPVVLAEIAEPLINLFFYYSIQMECIGQFRIMTIDAYIDKSTKQIDITKINQEVNRIKSALISKGFSKIKLEELLNQRKSKFPYNVATLLTIVSGKNFLIPFIKYHIDKRLNCNLRLPNEAWKFNLVERCDLNRLYPLKQALIQATQFKYTPRQEKKLKQ